MEGLIVAFVLQVYGLGRTNVVLAWEYEDVVTCVESSTNLVDWTVVTNMPATIYFPVPKDKALEFFRVSRVVR
jgi:hypothetical protein